MIFKYFGNIVDNLGDVRLFVEAAKLGGLSAAGRKLGLSPAAASARLFKLESVLHTRLFERTTRHLRLTDEGRAYLVYCKQALQALDDGHAFLQAGKSVVRGKVRISATSDFGRHVLKDWLDQFNRQYPEHSVAAMAVCGCASTCPVSTKPVHGAPCTRTSRFSDQTFCRRIQPLGWA